jgi:hypothetical protein
MSGIYVEVRNQENYLTKDKRNISAIDKLDSRITTVDKSYAIIAEK